LSLLTLAWVVWLCTIPRASSTFKLRLEPRQAMGVKLIDSSN
jgi:hypothetical protein